jgi:hypothetical protein
MAMHIPLDVHDTPVSPPEDARIVVELGGGLRVCIDGQTVTASDT